MKRHRSMIPAIAGLLVALALAFVVVAEAQRLKVTQCAPSATRASTAILEVHLLEPSASASPELDLCGQIEQVVERP